jgi:hypothetical protein
VGQFYPFWHHFFCDRRYSGKKVLFEAVLKNVLRTPEWIGKVVVYTITVLLT